MDETMTTPGPVPVSGAERYASVFPSSVSISTCLRITAILSLPESICDPLDVDLQDVVVDTVAVDEVHALPADLHTVRRSCCCTSSARWRTTVRRSSRARE